MSWYFRVLTNFSFDGRARRREYWYFLLFQVIVLVILAGISDALHLWIRISDAFELISAAVAQTTQYYYEQYEVLRIPVVIYLVLTIVQWVAVGVRRLHDRNMSGWWIIPLSIPVIGSIPGLIIFCLNGTPGPNKYGPDPKSA